MVDVLNGIWKVLGREIMFYLEKIVNTVKSRTDELRSVIDFGAPEAQKCTPDQTIKRLEEEIQQQKKNLEKSGSELKTQKDANKDLRKEVMIREISFRTFLKTYNTKCLEMDFQKDESIRHSMWFNEQMLSFNQAKVALGNNIAKKDKEIRELQKQLAVPVSPQVIFKLWRCEFFYLSNPLPQKPLLLHDLTAEDSMETPVKEKSDSLIDKVISEQKKTIDAIAEMENTIAKRLVVPLSAFFF